MVIKLFRRDRSALRGAQRRLPAHTEVRLPEGGQRSMALVELVDRPEVTEDKKEEAPAKAA
jgi:urease beta subunit